jgi:hypothetical protein
VVVPEMVIGAVGLLAAGYSGNGGAHWFGHGLDSRHQEPRKKKTPAPNDIRAGVGKFR